MVRTGTTYLSMIAIAVASAALPLPAEEQFKTDSHGLDRRNMNAEVDPCDDFYMDANGKWFERNPWCLPMTRGL